MLDRPNDRIREELLEVRGIVEPQAAALAARRASSEDIERLHLLTWSAAAEAIGRESPFRKILAFTPGPGARYAQRGALAREWRSHLFYQWDGQLPTGQDVLDHQAIYEAVRDRDRSVPARP